MLILSIIFLQSEAEPEFSRSDHSLLVTCIYITKSTIQPLVFTVSLDQSSLPSHRQGSAECPAERTSTRDKNLSLTSTFSDRRQRRTDLFRWFFLWQDLHDWPSESTTRNSIFSQRFGSQIHRTRESRDVSVRVHWRKPFAQRIWWQFCSSVGHWQRPVFTNPGSPWTVD